MVEPDPRSGAEPSVYSAYVLASHLMVAFQLS